MTQETVPLGPISRPRKYARLGDTYADLWWIRPAGLVWLVLLPLYLALPFLPDPPKDVRVYLGGAYYALGAGLLILLGISATLGETLARGRARNPANLFELRSWILDGLFALACAAYVIWFLEILLNPSLLLMGADVGAFAVKATVSNIPGITSFTQAAIPFFICYFVAQRYCGQALHPRHSIYAWILVLLICLRVFAWTEREALLEIVVPVVLLAIAARKPTGGWRERALPLLPIIGIVLLLTFFGVTEYFRSWISAYSEGDEGFLEFTVARISTYYVTAVNNALAFLSEDDGWPRWDGLYLFSGLYAMPGVGEWLKDVVQIRPDGYGVLLFSTLDPEFNNFSGLFFPVVELGIVPGALLTIVLGIGTGLCWNAFRRWSLAGLLFYPIVYVTILELLRVFYGGGARTVIPLALLVLILLFGFRRRRGVSHA